MKPAEPGVERVRRRYGRLAGIYPAFDLLLALPPGARGRTVERLVLCPGESVLEVGCGTGRNLPALSRAVGERGKVYGVDTTPEMLRIAERVRQRRRLANVELFEADVAAWDPPQSVDGILFSLSYSVLPSHREVLRHLWGHLNPRGRVVVLDGSVPDGGVGAGLGRLATTVSRLSVLGDASKRPWEDLGELTRTVDTERFRGGGYFLCRAIREA